MDGGGTLELSIAGQRRRDDLAGVLVCHERC